MGPYVSMCTNCAAPGLKVRSLSDYYDTYNSHDPTKIILILIFWKTEITKLALLSECADTITIMTVLPKLYQFWFLQNWDENFSSFYLD